MTPTTKSPRGRAVPTPEPMTQLLTRHEVAALLRIHIRTLDRITMLGEVPSVKVGKRRMYRADDIQHLINSHSTEG